MEIWSHLRAILLLPFVAIVIIPGAILLLTGSDTWGLWVSFPKIRIGLAIIGCGLFSLGLGLMVGTIRLFATVGRGTLAP